MTETLIIYGILSSSLVSVLVGLLGARRRIGFGWAYLLSILTTPLIGLIITLLFDKLPEGERKWGCLGMILAIIVIALIIMLAMGVFAAILGGDSPEPSGSIAMIIMYGCITI